MLAADAPQKRRKLLIRVVIERMLQVEIVERIDDARREPVREDIRQDQRRDGDDDDRLQDAQHQHADRRAADGDAQHRAVVQKLREIHRFFQQRAGIARAAARA